MSRSRAQMARPAGVLVPRWALVAAAAAVMLWAGLRIFVPPSWKIQRLDSPDGRISAMLLRTEDVRPHFVIHVRRGRLWHTAYYSPAIANDYRVDLGERLAWSPDSRRLYFRMNGRTIWGHDFQENRNLRPDEL